MVEQTILSSQKIKFMQVLVPHSHNVELEDFEVFSGHLALMKRINGLSVISMFLLGQSGSGSGLPGIASQESESIDFSEESYSLQLGEQGPYNSSMLRITYSSLVTPASTFDVNMTTGTLTVYATDSAYASSMQTGLHPPGDFCQLLQHNKQAERKKAQRLACSVSVILSYMLVLK
ncbi:MAG: hypothetical protein MMC33_004277 [Icmadophila ericetorum]|nr:hypothetical protein [Icmadophila ericetorum]